jgi:ubiquinol-cytochrome c reductase cytochrome c1 subunit
MYAFKKIWALIPLLVLAPALAFANSEIHLDKFPESLEKDNSSLQRGAKLFTDKCLACHSANYMRFSRLRDIGMTDAQVKKEINMPEDGQIYSNMQSAMDPSSAKLAYGVAPPDLSVIARARGADWLYTYLRTFYLDPSRPSGWNNTTFPNVGMPFVLSDMQGEQELVVTNCDGHETKKLVLKKPGSMTPEQFDKAMVDLTDYLVYMGDPGEKNRHQYGYMVLTFLAILLILVYVLKKEIWKDADQEANRSQT